MWSGADNDYLAAIQAPARTYTWHGSVIDVDGIVYSFDAGDIVKGSGQITRQVSSATALEIGTVYTAQLTIRLYKAINRYKLYDGTIELYCDVDVEGVTYSVPMGVYTISACTQEIGCISITAYDNMMALDAVTVATDQGQDTPFNWITYFCGLAGVTFGTSEPDIEAMPNGQIPLSFRECDTPLTSMTCRDALSYICVCLCANAYIDRDGVLYVKQYNMIPDDDIAANERFSSSLSDFTTHYTSITLGYFEDGSVEAVAKPVDDGLSYDLGINPFLQFTLQTAREDAMLRILNYLATVYYEPYTAVMPLRPEIDPMDVLTFSGNQAGTDIGAITTIVYKLGGQMSVKCSGGNPRLADARSRDSKTLSALVNRKSETDFYTYFFENTSPYSLAGAPAMVASLAVATVKAARLTMMYTVNIDAESSGRCYFDVYINGQVYKTFKDWFSAGKNVLNFHVSFNLTTPRNNYIYIYMRTEGDSTFTTNGTWNAIADQNWGRLSGFTWTELMTPGTYSDNPPNITIDTAMSQLTIFGRGLSATPIWDGQIVCHDDIGEGVTVPKMLQELTDTSSLDVITPIPGGGYADSFDLNEVRIMDNYSDSAILHDGLMYFAPLFETALISLVGVTVSNGKWNGSGELDDGTNGYVIIANEIYTSGISQITAVDSGGYWQLSFDGGHTWEGHSAGTWSQSTIMTTAQMRQLDNATLAAKGATMQIKVLLEASCTASSVTVEGGRV